MFGIAPGPLEQVDKAMALFHHRRSVFFLRRQCVRLQQQGLDLVRRADEVGLAAKGTQSAVDQESAGRVQTAKLRYVELSHVAALRHGAIAQLVVDIRKS